MSALVTAQQKFAQMAAMIIRAAYTRGYEVTLGHAWRCQDCPTGHKASLHKSRLAIDLILWRGHELLQGTEAEEAHKELHGAWSAMGGADMIEGDANHYSLAWDGMR